MKIIPIVCSNCGAQLDVKGNREFVYCEYCGTKLFIDDEVERIEITKNINQTNKTINVADAIRAHSSVIRAKNEDNKNKREHREFVLYIIFMLALLGAIAVPNLLNDVVPEMKGKIKVGTKSDDLVGEDYEYVERKLKDAGFSNIDTEPVDDLIIGFLAQEGEVKEITIKCEPGVWGE